MSYRLMFTINAIVAAVFGAVLLLLPNTVLLFFGMHDAVVATQFVARCFGGAMMVTAASLWLLQGSSKEVQKSEAFVMMIASVGGFILTIVGMSALNLIRANGWILLTLCVILAAGYAFLVFGLTVKKEE